MKGILKKTEKGWVVEYFTGSSKADGAANFKSLPIHPDFEDYCSSFVDWYEEEVGFSIVRVCTYCGADFCDNLKCRGHEDISYAKLILEESWDEIFERFNKDIADKEKYFVTASQLADWLKEHYNSPKRKHHE